MSEKNIVRDSADAIRGVVQAVPIYQDALQPATRELGIALQTVAKSIHAALAPITMLVWGYEKLQEFISTRVAAKLQNVPPERIRTPEAHVVGPALEALRYTGHEESLRELYANLLATSLDIETAGRAHPAFVEMIKSMSPDEARIMRLFSTRPTHPLIDLLKRHRKGGFEVLLRNYSRVGEEAGCDHPGLTPSYLNNLQRLGLVLLPSQGLGASELSDKSGYESLENSPEINEIRARFEQGGDSWLGFARGLVDTTALGDQFCQACVLEKSLIEAR